MTGAQIAKVRAMLGLTQVELASMLGVHALTVSKWEREVATPSPYQHALLVQCGRAAVARPDLGETLTELLPMPEAGPVYALYVVLLEAFGELTDCPQFPLQGPERQGSLSYYPTPTRSRGPNRPKAKSFIDRVAT